MTRYRPPVSGKYPIVTFRVREEFPRPTARQVDLYRNFFVPDVSDQVGRMYTMDQSIKPLYQPTPRLLGPALTLKTTPGDNMGMYGILPMVKPGDVLVVDAQGFMEWCLGGFNLLVGAIRERGLAGLMVNGAYRDVSQAQAANFPMFGRGVAPWSGPKRGPAEINVPICCGGVIIHPGDMILADADGSVVVPHDYIDAVAAKLADRPGLLEVPTDETPKDVAEEEATRGEYFWSVFKEKSGRTIS